MLDVGLVITDATVNGHTIKLRHEASLIINRHPDCAMTEDEVSAAIALLAAERGLIAD